VNKEMQKLLKKYGADLKKQADLRKQANPKK